MVSVVIPTYNEAENINVIVPRIFDVLRRSRLPGEVVIVDDDSPDGTSSVAAQLAGSYPVKIYTRRSERGLATAVMKGFELASGDVCLVMDADMSHPVEKIPDMVRPILAQQCEATVGSRYTEGGGCGDWSVVRQFTSRFSGFLARGLSKLSDPTSGFMAVRREIIQSAVLDPVGWKIVLEVIVKTGVSFREIPIVFEDRQHGESKLNTEVQAAYLTHLGKLYLFKYPLIAQLLKFCSVGFLGLMLDTAVLVALVEGLPMDPRAAAVFAFLSAVSLNYVLNRRWTFPGAKSMQVVTSYSWFVAASLLGLLVRLGIMHLMIVFLNMGVGRRYILASLIGIVGGTFVNFAGAKWIAFKTRFNKGNCK